MVEEKPKKKRVTKKQKESANVDNITNLLVAVFGVAGSRKGFEFWSISEAEARTVAEPLNRVLASYNMDEKLGKYADHIALVTACSTLVVPRAIMTYQIEKPKLAKKKEVKKIEGQIKRADTEIRNTDRNADHAKSNETAYFGSAIY